MDVIHSDLSDLLDFRTKKFEGQAPFSVATGYHLYAETRLDQSITAPTDKDTARKYLRFLQRFTWLCSETAELFGGSLLEAQGARTHLILPANTHNPRSMFELVELCAFLYESVKSEMDRRFPEKKSAIAFAADFGEAMMLRSRIEDSDSIVSLGNCANRPAKRLGYYEGGASADTVHSKELSIPQSLVTQEIIPYLDDADDDKWREVLLERVSVRPDFRTIFQEVFNRSFRPDRLLEDQYVVRDLSLNEIETKGYAQSGNAVSLYGWMLRADLDGFSAQIAAATSYQSKVILARRFASLMDDYNKFIEKHGPNSSIAMPWAGDCANMLLLPRGTAVSSESSAKLYRESRPFLPVIETDKWNKEMGESASRTLGSSWAVALAGGDPEGASFNMLRATLATDGRLFPIAVGKCVKVSSDGEHADWLEGDQVALYREDYLVLRKSLQNIFEFGDSKFYSSSKNELREAVESMNPPKSEPQAYTTRSGSSVAIPAQRPYYRDGG